MATRFRTIIPKLLPAKVFTDAFEKASRGMEKDVKAAFDDRVSQWKHKPVFRGYVRVDSKGALISVTTQDEIFKFVDEGTVPHIIKPKGRGYPLHWVDKSSGEDRFAYLVHHPGFKGRKFSEEIFEIWTGLMPDYFDKYLVEAIQQSGHALK